MSNTLTVLTTSVALFPALSVTLYFIVYVPTLDVSIIFTLLSVVPLFLYVYVLTNLDKIF